MQKPCENRPTGHARAGLGAGNPGLSPLSLPLAFSEALPFTTLLSTRPKRWMWLLLTFLKINKCLNFPAEDLAGLLCFKPNTEVRDQDSF